jgi:NAD(P)-dependent dehydrogenase (short-subunit alcohol dehydrogenase family)
MSSPSSSPFSLAGQIAVVTGGGTGLGLGIARCFVVAGARVVLVGRREVVLQKAVGELGEAAHHRVHDITHYHKNPALLEEIESSLGPIDILVNNAGVHLKKAAIETTESEFQSVLDTHLLAAFSLTRSAAVRMLTRGRGSILFIASMASFMGVPRILAYTAAKTACLGMVRGLAAELSPQNVRVNAIAPGWVQTPMTEKALSNDPERKSQILARTPMSCFGSPDDIGHAAVYLSSPAARFVTGTVLTVDGGASIGF